MAFKINDNIKMFDQVRVNDVHKLTESLSEVKMLTKNTEMNFNSKLSSRKSDWIHFLEDSFKIRRNIYFALQNNFLFMDLVEEEQE